MAISPTVAAVEAILNKRFTQFEDRTCLLLCDISLGMENRETKEHDILTKHIRELMVRVAKLETAHEQPDLGRLPFKAAQRIA